MIKKKIPYHQDVLIKAFDNQMPNYEKTKINTYRSEYQKTNQNNKVIKK